MTWNVEFTRTARRQFARIDRTWQRHVLDYLEDTIATLENPRSRGKALTGDLSGYWRYRIGDYRAICHITDSNVTIVVLEINHRSRVYR